jgi:predicted phage terminase large subunit-like protein
VDEVIDEAAVYRAMLREDLCGFIGETFTTVSAGDTYQPNWHIDAIAHHLTLCAQGRIRRLVITVPPRTLKSIAVSIAFVAWVLARDPTRRFICISYSDELAEKFSRDTRAVMMAPWYREVFPGTSIDPAHNTKSDFGTTAGGSRLATSVGGTLTGLGAHFLIVDDPLKAGDAYSAPARAKLQRFFTSTLLSRLDNQQEGVIIIVQQRLHEDDLAGYVLRENPGGWTVLNLPAIAPLDEKIAVGRGIWHQRREGELLHPAYLPRRVLDDLKAGMPSADYAAQYQQSPQAPDGNIVRKAWIRWYGHDDRLWRTYDRIVVSVDAAFSGEDGASYTAITTWHRQKDGGVTKFFLLDVVRRRLEFPELVTMLRDICRRLPKPVVLIENKASGQSLIQTIRKERFASPIPINPERDKVSRMQAAAFAFEQGRVFLPHKAPWLEVYLDELLHFPNGRFDDQVDSTSQILNWDHMRPSTRVSSGYF